MKNQNDNCYLIPHRLADVIRLIVVLAVEKHNFRTEHGLTNSLRGVPKSADSWLKLAGEHQEFFRFNKGQDSIILLIRFIQQVDVQEGELRPPLSVDQTQKLVDQAISLHDKQLARYQRNSFRFPMYGAIAAAIVALIVGALNFYSLISNNNKFDKRFDMIIEKLDSIKLNGQSIVTIGDSIKQKK